MPLKYATESQSQSFKVNIFRFSPEVLKKNEALHKQLTDLWVDLDNAESKYDSKSGLSLPANGDLANDLSQKLLKKSGYYMQYEGKAIGLAIVNNAEYDNTYWLSALVVDEKYRGWGLGKVFIDYIFKVNKPKRMILRVSMNNTAGLSLYKSCGFEPITQVMIKSK